MNLGIIKFFFLLLFCLIDLDIKTFFKRSTNVFVGKVIYEQTLENNKRFLTIKVIEIYKGERYSLYEIECYFQETINKENNYIFFVNQRGNKKELLYYEVICDSCSNVSYNFVKGFAKLKKPKIENSTRCKCWR